MTIAIIAVGYNRLGSLKTLLDSLQKADYEGQNVDLIISLDKSDKQEELHKLASDTEWVFGKKIIRAFEKRQGLRKHIISCGDYTEFYDAVVVLEDDLIVSEGFFSYVTQCVEQYSENPIVGGISLYRYYINPGVKQYFEPTFNGYDIFLMQYAMSWGQCWTKQMWIGFKKWYEDNIGKDLSQGELIPKYISEWNDSSWLKYYMRYIAETNKYFIYPYYSLSTNTSDIGEHNYTDNNDFQVPLLDGKMRYRFPTIEESIKYDMFFERVGIEEKIFPELNGKKILNLYGHRNNFFNARYIVSTRVLPYKNVKEIMLKFRPIELNCIYPQCGKGIYVYDRLQPTNNKILNRNNVQVTKYDLKGISWRRLLRLSVFKFKEAFCNKLSRTLKH